MTEKMISAQVGEKSVIGNNKSSFHNYHTNPDDHSRQTTVTPDLKPFASRVLQYNTSFTTSGAAF